MKGPTAVQSLSARVVADLPLVLGCLCTFVFCLVNQRPGQDWGDDFSLYLRQAKALTDGTVADVLADNRFTVENSSWSTFSPYSYPWGYPLLLAPVYAIRGLDYAAFKFFLAATFAVALYLFGRIVRRRLSEPATLVVVMTIGLSVPFVTWTDTVLSEFPYLLALFATLWWLDRCRERGHLAGPGIGPLALLGVLAGFTYSVRREGIAVLAAIVAVQLVDTVPAMWATRAERPWRGFKVLRPVALAMPYLAFGAWVGGLQLVLPTVMYQSFPGTGLEQVKPNVIWYRDILAEHLGLKDIGYPQIQLLGSDGLARLALGLFVAAAIVGVIVRTVRHLAIDASLVAYLLAVSAIFAITPFHEGRYLFSITPLLVYFAWQGVASAMRVLLPATPRRALAGAVAASVFIGVFTLANVHDLWRRTDLRRQVGDAVIWGPEDPTSLEMFEAVRANTDPDAVVAFFRARIMNLYSDRRSIQITRLPDALARADYYVMAKNSTYSQVLLTDSEALAAGMSNVWENANFVIYSISGGP